MDMQELMGYGIPANVAALWRARQGRRLLPLQEAAVRDHALFTGGNLLVQAPTSSGKTFIGEMAAVHAALQRRKAVFLTPLKALAVEKYVDFRDKYAPYGLRVIVCTRDHREFDAAFEQGEYDLAVAVYEKLEQLSIRRPERLREPAVAVADELEVLSDPERGAGVEVLLTRLLLGDTRLIGLSAVLGAPERPAAWMNARLLEYGRRPVELRCGVLCGGVFRYCAHNTRDEGEEALAGTDGDSPWEAVARTACRLAEQGEGCLIFVKARREARQGAALLAQRLSLPAAATAIERLRACEPTGTRDALLHTLESGAAFHSADLLPEERAIVEDAFRAGEVRVLTATGTLAAGMNLPARNVFLSTDKWVYDPALELPWRAPISQGEFENMSGRAGRYGAGADYGRAVLAAGSPFDCDSLWRRYIQGRREPIRPQLARTPPDIGVLQLIAARQCRSVETLRGFFAATLSGAEIGADADGTFARRIRSAVHRCLEAEMLQCVGANAMAGGPADDTLLEATPFGHMAACKGLSPMSAQALRHWLALSAGRDWCDLDFLTTLALLPDADLRALSLSRREYEQADYPEQLRRLTLAEPLQADVPLNRLRNCRLRPFYDEMRAVKAVLFLNAWMRQQPLIDIETAYHTTAGQIRAAADQLSWLADGAAALARARSAGESMERRLQDVSDRLRLGIREELLGLARAAPSLPRNALLALSREGLVRPEALLQAAAATLERWASPDAVRAIRRWAEHAAPPPSPAAPVLWVDDRHPGQVRLNGAPLPLQDKQYRMIRLLAAHADECVPYEVIYREVWGDVIVEDNQMHYQKRMLVKALTGAGKEYAALIGVVPKRGFTLNLCPGQVRLNLAATYAA